MKRKQKIVVSILTIFTIVFTSYGYAALNTKLSISGEAYVRVEENIRVTGLKLSSITNGGYETYNSKFSKGMTSMFVTLPSNGSATYEVEVTNNSVNEYYLKNIVSNTSDYEILDSNIYDVFPKNNTKLIHIKVKNTTSQTKNIALNLEYEFAKDENPTIALEDLPAWNTKGDAYAVTPTYNTGPSGGSVSCKSNLDTGITNVTNLKDLTTTGSHNITCIVTSNTGKTASVTKTTKITYDPYSTKNIVENGSFENDTYWKLYSASYSTAVAKSGNRSVALNPNMNYSSADHTIEPAIFGHKYYGITWFYTTNTFETIGNRFEWFKNDYAGGKLTFGWKGRTSYQWQSFSSVEELSAKDYLTSPNWVIRNFVTESNQVSYIDDVVIVDLTEVFGKGLEPDKKWCDKHIKYFDGTTTIYK